MQTILMITALFSLGFTFPPLAQLSNKTPKTSLVNKAAMMPRPNFRVQNVIGAKAQEFDLADVTLLDGPFKAAMERDATYLLSLSADRLLSLYRKEAGLEPKAPGYGGWEPRGGETLGHYMSALAMQYHSTGDSRFRERLNYILDELAVIQQKNGDGYIGGIPNGKALFAEVKAGDGKGAHREWVPWYVLHKLQAGLRDAYLYGGNPKARGLLVKFSDWVVDTTASLTPEQWGIMTQVEDGGMRETMADAYAITGNKQYLEVSEKFYDYALDALAEREDKLSGGHANTLLAKVIGSARLYELTGSKRDRTISQFLWSTVVNHHSYVTGGNSEHEEFNAPDQFTNKLGPSTAESYNTYNMLKLTRHLFEATPDVGYADYYERALYNHILASQEPEKGMTAYYMSLKPGHCKSYSTPEESFWCCTGTGMENHVKYGDSIYYHKADTLFVNGFIPSVLRWRDKGLTVRQDTQFPQSDVTKLTITADKPTRAALKIRCPGWLAKDAEVSVNGKRRPIAAKAGSYATIEQTWKTGDTIEVRLPMQLTQEALPDDKSKVAYLYGLVVLAGDLGNANMPKDLHAVEQDAYFTVPDPVVPVLVPQNKPLNQWLKPVEGHPLWFRTVGAGHPDEVTMKPFYDVHFSRYTVYWDVFTPSQWDQYKVEFHAREVERRAKEARRVDEMHFNEQQTELEHNLTGERSTSGRYGERGYRVASNGAWFAFDMKVAPDVPMELQCTYWGADGGNRNFNILVDGQIIATQRLNRDKLDEFFDVIYPIPAALTQGKTNVKVRFEPINDKQTAGGVFGCIMFIAKVKRVTE